MGATRSGRRFVSEINVTPFVDVMLVLLIIFMVTAPMMSEGLDVDLPVTSHVENLPTETDTMVMTITKDGSVYLDTYAVPQGELEEKLVLLVKEKNKQLFLQADKDVPYGTVVSIMGLIRKAGIDKLGIVAQREDATPAAKTGKAAKNEHGR